MSLTELRQWLDTCLEGYIAYILTREYYWGRSDTDLKREEKRRQAKKAKVVRNAEVLAQPNSETSGDSTGAVRPPSGL